MTKPRLLLPQLLRLSAGGEIGNCQSQLRLGIGVVAKPSIRIAEGFMDGCFGERCIRELAVDAPRDRHLCEMLGLP